MRDPIEVLASELRRLMGRDVPSDELDELLHVDEDDKRDNERDEEYKARQDRVKARKERLGVSSSVVTKKLNEVK